MSSFGLNEKQYIYATEYISSILNKDMESYHTFINNTDLYDGKHLFDIHQSYLYTTVKNEEALFNQSESRKSIFKNISCKQIEPIPEVEKKEKSNEKKSSLLINKISINKLKHNESLFNKNIKNKINTIKNISFNHNQTQNTSNSSIRNNNSNSVNPVNVKSSFVANVNATHKDKDKDKEIKSHSIHVNSEMTSISSTKPIIS